MGRPKKFQVDVEVFDGFSASDLKDSIVRNLSSIKALRSDLKDYTAGVNDTIKELEARNETALEVLQEKDPGYFPKITMDIQEQ